MRTISLNARTAYNKSFTAEEEVCLLIFRHPALATPIRLSTHPTEILSENPRTYGTFSTWQTAGDEPFFYCLVQAILPDDQGEAPPRAKVAFSNVDNRFSDLLQSLSSRPTCDMAVVLAGSPNYVEAAFYGLEVIAAEGNADQVLLSLSREPMTSSPYPSDRMTKLRFPGLHK